MPSYKAEKVNEGMLREMAQVVRELKDPRVNSGLVTITRCEVSGDLKYAKIYYSVYSGDFAEVRKGLVSAKGYIRREIAARLNLRNTPELTFISDDSLERGAKISKILDEMEFLDEEEEGSEE